jgi:L-alanine-DL-glutamate epimerase-like enolase superfamily enzyme
MGDVGISIAAGAHLACGIGPHQVDLDSHLNIEPICQGPSVVKGDLMLIDEPGLGVGLNEGWQKWRV